MEKYTNTLLFAGSLVFCLILAESGLQIYYRNKNGDWLFNVSQGFRTTFVAPVKDRRQYALRPGYEDELIRINELGYRGAEVKPDQHSPLIINIGDSVPFGYGVGDNETYPAVLGRICAKQFPGCGAINFGVASYNLRQSFDFLHIEGLPRYAPDLVIVQAANDVTLLSYYRGDWTPERTWRDVRWQSNSWSRIAIYHFVARAFFHGNSIELHLPHDPSMMLSFIRTLITEESANLRDRNIPIILIAANPVYYQVLNRDRNETMTGSLSAKYTFRVWDDLFLRYNETLREIASSLEGVYFFDPRPVFDELDRKRLYIDTIHLSREGHGILARDLMTFILDKDLIPNSRYLQRNPSRGLPPG